ncbi:DMT family transporter [Clostridium sp. MSJ-11]|uniref:DMT family transporter n=1 Tax=Clostridium mobile TaxID=2841512 RepID=A0ABS6EFA2_9CLOT|nr:DMT family transporter [Clostridium mobile]
MNNRGKAIAYMILSSLCFAIMAALVKMSGDIPTVEKTFFRNFVSLIVSVSIIFRKKQKPWGKRENRKHLILRGVLGTIGMITYFYCIDNMLLADSSMLNKVHPFFTIIFAVWFLKEKLPKIQIPALILAFIGILFVMKPKFDMTIIPAIIGISSAAFAGGAYTVVRYLGDKENSEIIVFYFSFISTLTAIMIIPFNYLPLTLSQFTMLIGAGVFAAIAQFSLTISYKYAPASEVSIYNYTNIIFAQIIAFFLWAEVPDIYSIIGYFLIIGSSLMVFLYKGKG